MAVLIVPMDPVFVYEDWKADCLELLANETLNTKILDQILKMNNQIVANGSLKSPLGEFTDDYLCKFCPKVIKTILKTETSDTNVDIYYLAILKSFCSMTAHVLPLQVDEFIEAVSLVCIRQDAPFYQNRARESLGYGSRFSPDYEACLRIFLDGVFMQKLERYLSGSLTIHSVRLLLSIVSAISGRVDQRWLTDCTYKALNLLTINALNLESNKLRELDEKEVNVAFDYLVYSNRMLRILKQQILKTQLAFNIELVKSSFLPKQFSGLKSIRSIVERTRDETVSVIDDLAKEKFVDCVIERLHYELVSDFVVVLREMIEKKKVATEQLVKFWTISVREHPGTIEHYMSGWKTLLFALSSADMHVIAETILESDSCPDSVLSFLSKHFVRFHEQQQERLMEKLTHQYETESKPETKQLIIDAMCANLPRNTSYLQELQKKCGELIQHQQNLGYAIPLLKQILNYLPIESSSSFMESILKMEGVDVVPLLELLSRIIRNHNTQVTDDQFHRIMDLTIPLVQSHPEVVSKFYLNTIPYMSLSSEIQLELFEKICRQPLSDPEIFRLLKSLFMRMNTGQIICDDFQGISRITSLTWCQGIDSLWSLLFSGGSDRIGKLLVSIYTHVKDPGANAQFIEQCMSHISSVGALKSLALFIHAVEDGVNKRLLGIKINRFMADSELITINLTGDIVVKIRVPKDMSMSAFISQVSQYAKKSRYSLLFREGERIISVDDVLVNGMTLTVSFMAEFKPEPPILVATLPCTILSKPEISGILMEILSDRDGDLSSYALNVLELIPTVPEENDKIWDKDTDWSAFLDVSRPYLLIYRLNILGKMFRRKQAEDWVGHFVDVGLDAFFHILFLDEMAVYTKTLFRCAKEMTEQFKRCEELPVSLENYHDRAVKSLVSRTMKSIECSDQEMIALSLSVLELFSSDILIDENVTTLAKVALFHENVRVRNAIQHIISSFSTENRLKLLLPLYDMAATHVCTQYFVLLTNLARETEFKTQMWQASIEQLFIRFSVPENISGLDQLTYFLPKPQFYVGLLKVLLILLHDIMEIDNSHDIFTFAVSNLLLSDIRYFQPQAELCQFIQSLMLKLPELQQLLMRELCQMAIPRAFERKGAQLSSVAIHKGIRNLGSTCYINATLQQFYHVPEFRAAILSRGFGRSEEEWQSQLQYLFAQLTFYPLTYVDPSPFVSVWKGWDGQLINPRQQQDAVEFCQILVDRIESVLPDLVQMFKGEIVHHISGVGNNLCYSKDIVESFVTFPLEVKDHLCIEDSLKSFLLPERFEGQNQYFMEGAGKIDAESFSRVRKAPTILIVMLKRFEYNMRTGLREKLNDKYIFHTELDLTPVMENPNESVKYELCGIVRHLGSAKGGHYISDILLDKSWGTFNDECFSWSSNEKVRSASFGGYQFVDVWDEKLQKYVTRRQPINGNAYLLFYRRVGIENLENPDFVRPMDEQLQNRLLVEIKDILHSDVMASQRLTELLLEVKFTAEFDTFIFEYFKNVCRERLDSSPRISKELFERFVQKCIEYIHSSENFCSLFYSDIDSVYDFLVTSSNKDVKSMYTLVLSECSLIAPADVKERFVKDCVEKVLNDGDGLMAHYENIDDFFRIFEIMKDCADEDTWPAIFFNFLLTHVLEYAPQKKLESVLQEINLSSVFDILRELIVKTKRQRCFQVQVFDLRFLESFMLSAHHARAFIEFLLIFPVSFKDVTLYMKNCEPILTPASAAGFIVLACALSEMSFEYILSFFDTKSSGFVENLLDELAERLKGFDGSLAGNLAKLTEGLVHRYLISQERCLRMSMVNLISAAQLSPIDSFVILTSEFDDMMRVVHTVAKAMVKGTLDLESQYFPISEYCELLQETIIRGKLQAIFIERHASTVLNALKRLGRLTLDPNYPRDCLVLFIIETLGPAHAGSFFSVVSFNAFLGTLHRMVDDQPKSLQLLLKLLQFIPPGKVDLFFKNPLFGMYSRVIFLDLKSGNSVKQYILRRTHPGNVSDIGTRLWEHECLRLNVHNCGYEYFSLSWNILRRFPSVSDCFWSMKAHEMCMLILNNDVYHNSLGTRKRFIDPAVAKLVAVFNEAYLQQNQGKSSLFTGDYVRMLARCYENEKLLLYFHEMSCLTEPIPRGKCGFFQLISSWMKLSKTHAETVLAFLEKSQVGYIWKLPKFAHRRAAEMVGLACTMEKQRERVFRIITRELRDLCQDPQPSSIHPLCACLQPLTADLVPELIPLMDHMLEKPELLGSACGSLLLEILKFDQSPAPRWCSKAVSLLSTVVRSSDPALLRRDADTVLVFLSRVCSIVHVDISPPSCLHRLKENLSGQVLSTGDPVDVILARIFPQ